MTMMTADDLKRLPSPKIIEALDFEALLRDRTEQLNALSPVLFDESVNPQFERAELYQDEEGKQFWRVNLPEDAGLMFLSLESDPVTKQTEVAAYRELLIRQRINDALASNLLALSSGSDLDNLAAFYDVLRLQDETDDQFRARVQLSIRGWAPGTVEYYEFQCRSASTQIRDVQVSVPDNNLIDQKGWIYISLMENNDDGQASQELLDAVFSHVNHPTIRLINDTLVVQSVELIPLDLVVTVTLLPDALPGTPNLIRSGFPGKFDAGRGLDFDITTDWLSCLLRVPGVKKIALNVTDDISIAPNQCAWLRSFEVIQGGQV